MDMLENISQNEKLSILQTPTEDLLVSEQMGEELSELKSNPDPAPIIYEGDEL